MAFYVSKQHIHDVGCIYHLNTSSDGHISNCSATLIAVVQIQQASTNLTHVHYACCSWSHGRIQLWQAIATGYIIKMQHPAQADRQDTGIVCDASLVTGRRTWSSRSAIARSIKPPPAAPSPSFVTSSASSSGSTI